MTRVPIGRTVRRMRTERNLSQQALANQLAGPVDKIGAAPNHLVWARRCQRAD